MSAIKKILALGLLCLGALFVIGWIYLGYSYSQTMPRVPEPKSGRVYAIGVNKVIVYVTKAEEHRLIYLWSLALVAFAAGTTMAVRYKLFANSMRDLSPEQRYRVLTGLRTDYKKTRETYERNVGD